MITEIGPDSAAETFTGPIESIASNQGTAGVAFVLGLAVALWSASGYVGAFIRASNVIYETDEGRPVLEAAAAADRGHPGDGRARWRCWPSAWSSPGRSSTRSPDPIGIGSTAVTLWDVAKWPAMAAIFVAHGRRPLLRPRPTPSCAASAGSRPGSLVAIVVWAVASAAFAFYVANFGSYDKTYGTLGGLVALLVWLWITNLAILFGHELNAELDRLRPAPSLSRRGDRPADSRNDGKSGFRALRFVFPIAPPGTGCACPSCDTRMPASTSSG